jgi:hypothetical protein
MEPICHNCAHFFVLTGSGLLDPAVETCTAFYPAPIPQDIMLGEVGHSEPHPNQHNREILFLSMSPLKKPRS